MNNHIKISKSVEDGGFILNSELGNNHNGSLSNDNYIKITKEKWYW